jgi:signal peptidase I
VAKKRNKPARGAGAAHGRPDTEPAAPAAGPGPLPPRTSAQVAADWAKSIGGAVILFLVLRTFLLQTFVITSSSMERTLLVGDFLVLSKAAYGAHVPFTNARLPGYTDPERGDVVVFRPPHDPGLDVVKRVIGMPGDTLQMTEKALYINGTRQNELYTRHSDVNGNVAHPWMRWQCGERVALSPDISGAFRVPESGYGGSGPGAPCNPTRDDWGPLVVPAGHYFMMGDNRDDSVDSRYWGFLDGERIRGEVLVIYYSYDPELLRPLAFLRNARAERIGDVVR